MADITEVINVSLAPAGRLAARENMNICGIVTDELGHLSTAKRFDIYRTLSAVAADFGSYSKAYAFASSFFGTSPNPVNAGGYLVIGYWRAVDEDTVATKGNLSGAQLSESSVVGQLQTITDGQMELDIDGVTETLTALNFTAVTTLDGAASVVDSALTGASAAIDNIGMVITSDTTGASSIVEFATDDGTGTFIGDILALTNGSGAVSTDGIDAGVISAESKIDAITAIQAESGIRGAMFTDKPTDVEASALAAWAQANSVLMYDVFNLTNLAVATSNVVWAIKLAGQTNYRCLLSAASNRKLAATYMARAHTVNFNTENSAITMNLKELSVSAEDYTDSELVSAKTVGLDVYTTIKDTPVVLTSSANDFVDNRYNLIGYIDAVQTDAFNLLKSTSTKIPQTVRGVNSLVDQLEKTTRGFVRAAVFAPGTWTSPDSFGDLATFTRNIAENGFYFLAGRLSDQSQQDRQDRKSPVIQGAVKNAGAIHSADIVILFNE